MAWHQRPSRSSTATSRATRGRRSSVSSSCNRPSKVCAMQARSKRLTRAWWLRATSTRQRRELLRPTSRSAPCRKGLERLGAWQAPQRSRMRCPPSPLTPISFRASTASTTHERSASRRVVAEAGMACWITSGTMGGTCAASRAVSSSLPRIISMPCSQWACHRQPPRPTTCRAVRRCGGPATPPRLPARLHVQRQQTRRQRPSTCWRRRRSCLSMPCHRRRCAPSGCPSPRHRHRARANPRPRRSRRSRCSERARRIFWHRRRRRRAPCCCACSRSRRRRERPRLGRRRSSSGQSSKPRRPRCRRRPRPRRPKSQAGASPHWTWRSSPRQRRTWWTTTGSGIGRVGRAAKRRSSPCPRAPPRRQGCM
mmetsp:Transcript_21447/g.70913  ORF Transcript_21447/g.70913 Transcript_21447/m.70913 type:complete len:368 (-) Transcript_21447:1140-2243(-)